MATGSTSHDYTQEPQVPFVVASADDFEIPDVQAISKSAEDIEMEGSFNEIPIGDHEVVILGFLGAPKEERKDAYVNGKRVGFVAHSVIVKFGLVSDPTYQVTDYMLLPPGDPVGLQAYYDGSKAADGKKKGFMASKFYHFIERVGFPYIKGQPLSPDARRLGNWKGRRVHLTVDPGDAYFDQKSGEEKPGRNQVKLFSYRTSQATVDSMQSQTTQPNRPAQPPIQPTRPAAQPQVRGPVAPVAPPASRPTAPQSRGPVQPRGLDNI